MYGEAIPTYGGDFRQLAKKRKADVVAPVEPQKQTEDNVVTVSSMFQEEASETPADKDPETPTDKDPELMDLTQDKEPLQGNNE